MSGDPRSAEDGLQAAFAKVYASWGKVRRADHPEAYVRRIVLNEVLGARRYGFARHERPHASVEPTASWCLARSRSRGAGRGVVGRSGTTAATARGGGPPLLRGPERGARSPTRSAARAAREVPGLERPGHLAPDRRRPRPRGGAMSETLLRRGPGTAPGRRRDSTGGCARVGSALDVGATVGGSPPRWPEPRWRSRPSPGPASHDDVRGLSHGRSDTSGYAELGSLDFSKGPGRTPTRAARSTWADARFPAEDLAYLDTDAVATNHGVVFFDTAARCCSAAMARSSPWSMGSSTGRAVSSRRPRPTRRTRGSPGPPAPGARRR